MPGEHLTRDLRVAGLVSANQAHLLQTKQEEVSAEGDERESIGGAPRALREDRSGSQEYVCILVRG